ncbi:hypothetical protein HL658_09445 [Azospirillum sp. RWY-5-1]|uniref:Uncharacterized protein n=1 Tax=Azospirillum oleiclasticum TaxID=2735135 RepID=A0ABX2T6I0_9PROT|nr:hypothetical protein [Azospirillum oleiclasticum]NYZ12775.1 hypothetical protein [Azospirillum oleiclasticum]NYZ19935.1 hypothetical protein [Azospirillum oleiclasticum]
MSQMPGHAVLTRLGALRETPEPLAALLVDLRGVEHADDPHFVRTLDHYLESWLGTRKREMFRLPGPRLLILAPADAPALLRGSAEALGGVLRHHGFGQLAFTVYDVATEAVRMVGDILPPDLIARAGVLATAARVPTAALGDLLEVERALQGADLGSLVREQPIWSFVAGGEPEPVRVELAVAIDELEARLGVPLRRNSWLRHEAAALMDRGLLRHLRIDRAADDRRLAIDLHTGTILDDDFPAIARAIPGEQRERLTAELACWEFGLSLPRVEAAAARLADLGMAVAADHVPLETLATLDLGAVTPTYVKALWRPDAPDAGARLADGVRRFGVDRLVLWRCDTPDALETGRAAGVILFQGHAADTATRATRPPSEAPPATVGAEEADSAAETAAEPAVAGLLGRLFGRG